MGLMSDLLTRITGKSEGESGTEPVLAHVVEMLHGHGGLNGVVEAFHAKGLGEIVKSWVGPGANAAVTPEQLDRVFGEGRLQQLAAKAGLTPEEFKAKVAQVLPGIVDKLTPGGHVPSSADQEDPLETLPKKG